MSDEREMLAEVLRDVRRVIYRRDAEGTDDLDADIRAAIAPQFARLIAAAKGEAWDEGYEEGADDTFGTREANPYRAALVAPTAATGEGVGG